MLRFEGRFDTGTNNIKEIEKDIPAVHRFAGFTANFFILSALLVLSVVVIFVGKIPGRMQLTRIFILIDTSLSV